MMVLHVGTFQCCNAYFDRIKIITRMVFERNMCHYFCRFNVKQPVYINFIRDPFERIVSGFYFLKRSARRAGRFVSDERFDMVGVLIDVFYKFY